jgi:hypothetical protein
MEGVTHSSARPAAACNRQTHQQQTGYACSACCPSLRHPLKVVFSTQKEVMGLLPCICLFSCTCSYVQRAVRLKEAASRWFFQQLIIGLDYCHRRGVVNRDIKLENTLLQVRAARHAVHTTGCATRGVHAGGACLHSISSRLAV